MPLADGRTYKIYSGDLFCYATQTIGNQWITVACPEQDNKYWWHYFDLKEVNSTDYREIKSLIKKEDKYLQQAILHSPGIRILNQDLWDTVICFLISQNNNIKRIRNSVWAMIEHYGSLPVPSEIRKNPEALEQFHLGYRKQYIQDVAKAFGFPTNSYQQMKQSLMLENGIGPKVADCICLYGYHWLQACPMDVHMKRIIAKHYPDGIPEEYKEYMGVFQQYMFAYDLGMS